MSREWYKTEKGKKYCSEYQKKWRSNNREHWNEYNRKYYQKTKMIRRLSSKKCHDKVKPRLLEILGGAKCKKCGFSDIRALQFDHINGGGNKEAKSFKSNGKMLIFYRNNPELAKQTLQVLCANCNWIKKHENKEVTKNTVIYSAQ